MAGEELARVVNAMLSAAELIDWGSEYTLSDGDMEEDGNTNEVEGAADGSRPRKTGGAWRLLMDQKNQAQWSPLHLVFVQGGICDGKVSLAKALLQMSDAQDDEEEDEQKQSRQHALRLVDRQNRTMLHHNCESRGPRDDNFDAAHFLISQCPSMLFVRDGRGSTPLEYVLNRLTSDASTKSGLTVRGDDNEDCKRSYRMLKLLVCAMEREENRFAETGQDELQYAAEGSLVSSEDMHADADENNQHLDRHVLSESDLNESADVNIILNNHESGLAAAMRNLPQHEMRAIAINENITPRNVLHSACRLSREICPHDGSLITFLASSRASRFEYGRSSAETLASDRDENGNYALHILLSNHSYASATTENPNTDERVAKDTPVSSLYLVVRELISAFPSSVRIANNDDVLPLRLTMEVGCRNVVTMLVKEYPQAILMDSKLENIKVFVEVLICISQSMAEETTNGDGGAQDSPTSSNDVTVKTHAHLLTIMYFLVRSRPDVVALGGSVSSYEVLRNKQAKKTSSWFKRLVSIWKS